MFAHLLLLPIEKPIIITPLSEGDSYCITQITAKAQSASADPDNFDYNAFSKWLEERFIIHRKP